jgi:glycosyltransferase involved in cell wall biosynthesis
MFSPYSVLLSVYAKEDGRYLSQSLNSMSAQTIPPDEIVLVEDGNLTAELHSTIETFALKHKGLLNIVRLDRNKGLGYALSRGLAQCNNEIIVRMDSDDYAFPQRVEKQLLVMETEHLDIVGSQVVEFIGEPSNIVAVSSLPIEGDEIIKYSRKRNPFRHPSIIYRKSKVVEAGNYSSDFLFFEDWELFNRMLANGCKARNINESLVAMRVSEDYYRRRGGLKYTKCIWKFKVAQLRRGYFKPLDFAVAALPHIFVSMLPNFVRSKIYDHFLRKKQ